MYIHPMISWMFHWHLTPNIPSRILLSNPDLQSPNLWFLSSTASQTYSSPDLQPPSNQWLLKLTTPQISDPQICSLQLCSPPPHQSATHSLPHFNNEDHGSHSYFPSFIHTSHPLASSWWCYFPESQSGHLVPSTPYIPPENIIPDLVA